MRTPDTVNSLYLEHTCASVNIEKWDELMQNSTKADVKKINKLVKKHLPGLFNDLSLGLRNPYDYFKTKDHLILVHSAIEYFLNYS